MLKTSSIAEQVAAHLREELNRGRWTGRMPGRERLARELGASGTTIDRALGQLEREGILRSQGAGKRRQITLPRKQRTPTVRVTMLLYEFEDAMNRYTFELRHQLKLSGHDLSFAPQTLMDLKQDPKRVATMVKKNPADAWIIQAGSKPVLEWFSNAPVPGFALFGRMLGTPIAGAGPDHRPAIEQAVEKLVNLGHRRIVMLNREERRKPSYGPVETFFLEQLKLHGLPSGAYNVPDWEETTEGLSNSLNELYRVTPPTAILVADTLLFLSVYNFLARRKAGVFDQTALICTDYNPSFKWCTPPVAHFNWDYQSTVRLAVRWVNNVARGRHDIKQRYTPSKFIGAESLPVNT